MNMSDPENYVQHELFSRAWNAINNQTARMESNSYPRLPTQLMPQNVVTNSFLSGESVSNDSFFNPDECMEVDINDLQNDFQNVPSINQSIPISLAAMRNNMIPTTSEVSNSSFVPTQNIPDISGSAQTTNHLMSPSQSKHAVPSVVVQIQGSRMKNVSESCSSYSGVGSSQGNILLSQTPSPAVDSFVHNNSLGENAAASNTVRISVQLQQIPTNTNSVAAGQSNSSVFLTVQQQHATEPERTRNQQYATLLMHAIQCLKKSNQANEQNQSPCTLPRCDPMKKLLKHAILCQTRKCAAPQCAPARSIISKIIVLHVRDCNLADCLVCCAMKRACQKRNNGTSGINIFTNSTQSTNQLASSLPHTQQLDGVSTPNLSSVLNSVSGILAPNVSLEQMTNSTLSGVSQPNLQSHSGESGEIQSNVSAVSDSVNLSFSSNTLDSNLPSSPGENELAGGNGNTIGPTQNSNKAWCNQISQRLRETLIQKLIHVIIPSNQVRRTSPSLLMQKLDSYARKVEKDVFETATSKSEYYTLLAQKYYLMQRRLVEVLIDRRREQQRRQQQMLPPSRNLLIGLQQPHVPQPSRNPFSRLLQPSQLVRRTLVPNRLPFSHSVLEEQQFPGAPRAESATTAQQTQNQHPEIPLICVICLIEVAHYLMNPCGHFGLCGGCKNKLVEMCDELPVEQCILPRCPVCRAYVEEFTEVFFSSALAR